MRPAFVSVVIPVVLFAAAVFSDHAGAADVPQPPPGYGPPPAYTPPPPDYGPPSHAYGPPPDAYEPPPGYRPRVDYGPPPGYGPPPEYAAPLRGYGPAYPLPYAASPVRPGCDLQWRCGPWGCGLRRVCYPEIYARHFRGYGPPPRVGEYGPY